jgi:biotin operon repressor
MLSIPFRYPLLKKMNRTDAMVMSAILFAFRLHQQTGKYFYLSDAKIMEWTGYKRTALYEARKRLEAEGWLVVRRGHGGYNMYMITDAVMARLEEADGQSREQQQERLRKSAEKAVSELNVEQAIARILLTFILRTGRMPTRKALRRWIVAARKIKDHGYSADTIADLIHKDDRSLFALLKRIEQGAVQKKKRIEYEVTYDPDRGWFAIPHEVEVIEEALEAINERL